jgi:hypothetical protein
MDRQPIAAVRGRHARRCLHTTRPALPSNVGAVILDEGETAPYMMINPALVNNSSVAIQRRLEGL